jgi:hypothetical protein
MRCTVEQYDGNGKYKIAQIFCFIEICGYLAGLRILQIIMPLIRFWSDCAINQE